MCRFFSETSSLILSTYNSGDVKVKVKFFRSFREECLLISFKLIDELADEAWLLGVLSKLNNGTIGSLFADLLSYAMRDGFSAHWADTGILLILSSSPN